MKMNLEKEFNEFSENDNYYFKNVIKINKDYESLNEIFINFLKNKKDIDLKKFYINIEKEVLYSPVFAENRYDFIQIAYQFIEYLKTKSDNKNIKHYINKNDLSKIKEIELMKLLQYGNDIKGLASDLNIKRETKKLNTKLLNIQDDGIDIYGNLVQINTYSEKSHIRRTEVYDCDTKDKIRSINPIGLALNHIEIYVLLVKVIKELDKDSIYYETYKNIACKIYTQLSLSAKEMVDKNIDKGTLKNVKLEYNFPDMKSNDFEDFILYCEKSGTIVEVLFLDNDKIERKISGVILCEANHNGNITLQSNDINWKIEIPNIISIKEK